MFHQKSTCTPLELGQTENQKNVGCFTSISDSSMESVAIKTLKQNRKFQKLNDTVITHRLMKPSTDLQTTCLTCLHTATLLLLLLVGGLYEYYVSCNIPNI